MLVKDLSRQKLLKHTGRCFDVRYSTDGLDILSASEEGTAILWDANSKKPTAVFKHNMESEVLRVAFLDTHSTLITTCGADGKAILWKRYNDESEICIDSERNNDEETLSSSARQELQKGNDTEGLSNHRGKRRTRKEAILPHGPTQIYACESLNISNSTSCPFMTAADSSVYLWDVNACTEGKQCSPSHIWTVGANSSNSNSPVNTPDGEPMQGFGGPRNPDNVVYIFDAKVNPTGANVIALALSDGSIRQIDIRSPSFISTSNTATSFTSPSSNANRNSHRDEFSPSALSSISLTGLSTSPTRSAEMGNTHATAVSYSDDGLTILAALGCGDVAVVDLRMGLVRSLLHAHTRTCYGAAFNVTLPSTLSTSISGAADISSRGKVADAKIGSALDSDADYEDSKTAHKRNLDFSDDKDDKQYESKIEPSSGQCITWSSDCSVRSWDTSVDGLCTDPVDMVVIPDFPIFCCSLRNKGEDREFVCGGGNGDTSFVGTPIYLFSDPKAK